MKTITTYVNLSNVANKTEMKVILKRFKQVKFRMWLSMQILKLFTWISPCSIEITIEGNVESPVKYTT